MSAPIVIDVGSDKKPRRILDAASKLRFRATLPGAQTYDEAAHLLRTFVAEGVDSLGLLPLACSSSWLVNARASSRAFRAWRGTEGTAAWKTVLSTLRENLPPEEVAEIDDDARKKCASAISMLSGVGHGASLAAVSKVLTLLRPHLSLLMDDAAIAFVLGDVAEPENADDPKAEPKHFWPMIDWFAATVAKHEKALNALAAAHDVATIDGAQALDRLVWFESWGWRHDSRYWRIVDKEQEVIVKLDAARPDAETKARTVEETAKLAKLEESALRDRIAPSA
jgi:hypothetical protein